MKERKFILCSNRYISKKFLGFVFAIDFDKPIHHDQKWNVLFEIKFLWLGFWVELINLR